LHAQPPVVANDDRGGWRRNERFTRGIVVVESSSRRVVKSTRLDLGILLVDSTTRRLDD